MRFTLFFYLQNFDYFLNLPGMSLEQVTDVCRDTFMVQIWSL